MESEHIKLKKSKIHGNGVFAKNDIKKGIKVIEYLGEKVTKEEADMIANIHMEKHLVDPSRNGAVYLFELNDKYDLDGDVEYNTAKWINHSCEPNCEIEIKEDRIWIIALKDIKKGEEVTYNYSYEIEDYKDHPCVCKSKNCVGYILAEEHWNKINLKEKE